MDRKVLIRTDLKARRRAVPAALAAHWSARLVEVLRALVVPRPLLRLGVYWPHTDEPDLRPLLLQALRRGAHVCLPDQGLQGWGWRRVLAVCDNAPVLGEATAPEIALVPGIGFDTSGRRLGYGRGIYDRLLAATPTIAVGVAFPVSCVRKIPSDIWDVPMHMVATPFGIYLPEPRPANPRRSFLWNL